MIVVTSFSFDDISKARSIVFYMDYEAISITVYVRERCEKIEAFAFFGTHNYLALVQIENVLCFFLPFTEVLSK